MRERLAESTAARSAVAVVETRLLATTKDRANVVFDHVKIVVALIPRLRCAVRLL
jgi:hypothetical protein